MSIRLLSIKVSDHPLWKEHVKTRVHLRDINYKYWLDHNLFTPVWWLMVIFSLAIWFVWWKLVNKARLLEIVTYGTLISLLAGIVDVIGTEFVLWGYPNQVLPLVPPLVFVDLCALPVIYMLVYQYFRGWKEFALAILITSSLLAFVFEPLTIWLDIYQMNHWRSEYSLPIYIVPPLFLKWMIEKILGRQLKEVA